MTFLTAVTSAWLAGNSKTEPLEISEGFSQAASTLNREKITNWMTPKVMDASTSYKYQDAGE